MKPDWFPYKWSLELGAFVHSMIQSMSPIWLNVRCILADVVGTIYLRSRHSKRICSRCWVGENLIARTKRHKDVRGIMEETNEDVRLEKKKKRDSDYEDRSINNMVEQAPIPATTAAAQKVGSASHHLSNPVAHSTQHCHQQKDSAPEIPQRCTHTDRSRQQ